MNWLRNREEFIDAMAREGMNLEDTRRVLRLAATVQRLAVEARNRDLTEAERKRNDTAENAIVAVAKSYGWPLPIFQSDPRGACVKMRVPSGQLDYYGRAGVAVPTREY